MHFARASRASYTFTQSDISSPIGLLLINQHYVLQLTFAAGTRGGGSASHMNDMIDEESIHRGFTRVEQLHPLSNGRSRWNWLIRTDSGGQDKIRK